VNEPALGATGGEEQHTLTTTEMPAHTHTVSAVNTTKLANTSGSDSVGASFNNVITSSSVGGGGAHNNLQPYLAINHIIKVL
jgi:microcystin-dependent protein